MADDKQGRDDQAHDEANRQRAREVEEALERGDEPEPEPVADPETVAALEPALEPLEYPATGSDIVAAVGDAEITAGAETLHVAELIADEPVESFGSPTAVLERVERPTVARAMKRIAEASSDRRDGRLRGSQQEAYEKTFAALAAIDTVDENAPVAAVADWVVGRISETGALPGSRAVRRQAAAHCRDHGYQVQSDEWLGV